ncbi:hypothetical protein [Saccharothrix coeruleofusca]|uniref:Uncharacterized protein n=1 Tax=Saccharothrix coeruleofusca TaxID=33919 RepID=A0A918EBH4_9PSEU|nr:hypothetical protein [Saccharothrix coeruleofusca]GGP35959.1 hypothetical protein GCM10010185_03690 [Saccharothrix coeruleofusca]
MRTEQTGEDMSDRYPDGLTSAVLEVLGQQVSQELADLSAPTSALLDGSALERRNRRIAARALAGVTARYGVTLAQTVAESGRPVQLRGGVAVHPSRVVEALAEVA